MEDFFRIIYAFCIIFIRFPLYYLAPLQNELNIYDDHIACNKSFKDIVYKSESAMECDSLKYSSNLEELNITEDNVKEFLCLGMYDTVFKMCSHGLMKPLEKITSPHIFDSTIGDLVKSYQINDPTKLSQNLCNALIGYKVYYKDVKPVLTKLIDKLQRPEVCFSICFNFESNLKTPLCAMLAWINKIDHDIEDLITNGTGDNDDDIYHKDDSLQTEQEDHKDLPKIEHKTVNLKHLEKEMKNSKPHNDEKPTASTISTNNTKTVNIIINNNTNTNNIPNIQLSQSNKDNPTKINDEENLSKSDPTVKTTTQSTSNPLINNNESHDKPNSLSKETDKKQVDDNNNNSQEPPPNLEEDELESKKKDKVDPETNLITEKSVNQAVTETKFTEAYDNLNIIISTESNVAADNSLIGSNSQKMVPTEDIDLPGGIDNPSESMSEPSEQRTHFENDEESHFLFYFAVITIGFIGGYTGYHNKKKLLAILLKGRRSKNNRGRRRSGSPKYRKLDCTLEEAVTSQCNANVTHVIY